MRRVPVAGCGPLLIALAIGVGGCTTLYGRPENLPPTSIQTLEYYPRQVKGYQNSYPPRRLLVLPALDAREFPDPTAADHQPDSSGNVAIGVVLGRDHRIVQRLYSSPLEPIVQKAFAASAGEAGLSGAVSDQSLDAALGRASNADYLLVAKVTRGWVKRQRGADGRYGPIWATTGEFAAEVTIYKPPFHTPFWKGPIAATYDDPPQGLFAGGPDDDTSVYDEPGQVLSVAFTRAVAGLFRRSDLRSLILEDIVHPR